MIGLKYELYKRVVYPIYQYRYGYRAIKVFDFLTQSQWFSKEKLWWYQYEKVKRLLKYAYVNIPYYRRTMDESGFRPDEFKSLDDITHLPILDKQTIRENHQDIFYRQINRFHVKESFTGGSTGEPLKYRRDMNTIAWSDAALLRGKKWANYNIGLPLAHFKTIGRPSVRGRIRESLIRIHSFPAFSREQEIIENMVRIKKIGPYCLESYATTLYRIASVCSKHGVDGLAIPAIFSTGEMLYPHQRTLIERQFNGRVFDYYGCNEIGCFAHECCEYHSKHISDEHVIIETVDADGKRVVGQQGEIVVTDLDNYAMPFIRYRVGDVGVISEEACGCGRKSTILKRLEGRTGDFLRTSEGDIVPPIIIMTTFRNIKGIQKYQVIQTEIGRLDLVIEKNSLFSEMELLFMVRELKTLLGEGTVINVREEGMKPTSRGKFRTIISKIPVLKVGKG